MYSVNLFGTGWIVLFNLWELPINSFYNIVDVIENYKPKQTERFITDLKNEFPRVFSVKTRAVHKNRSQVFIKRKCEASTIFGTRLNKWETGKVGENWRDFRSRLLWLGVSNRIYIYIYIYKKNRKIRVCADFSTGSNDYLKGHAYPIPSPEVGFILGLPSG